MPIGMCRFGLLDSSAVVETASKPRKAKKTSAGAAPDPAQAGDPNWPWFGGIDGSRGPADEERPAPMTTRMMATLTATMTELALALSLIPRTRTTVMRAMNSRGQVEEGAGLRHPRSRVKE